MKFSKLIILSSLFVVFFSCEKAEEVSTLSGNIVGFVDLKNEDGHDVEDKSGVSISIENKGYTASTNAEGRFELVNIPAGTFNLHYSKEGYDTITKDSYQFVGGNIPALLGKETLIQIPTVELTNLKIDYNQNLIHLSGSLSKTGLYDFEVYLSRDEDVSFDNYEDISGLYQINPETLQFNQAIDISDAPFSSGEDIYLIIYVYSSFIHQRIYNPELQINVRQYGKKLSEVNKISI